MIDLLAMEYHIVGCMSQAGMISPELLTYGDDDINIWTISRTREPTRIWINFNGLFQVFDILPSADTCTSPRVEWEWFWSSDQVATEFFFKAGGPGLLGYRVIDMPGNYKRAESLCTGTLAIFLAY